MPYYKKNKYHAKGGKCLSGHYHPSTLERNYCDQLALLQRSGEIIGYEYAKRYPLVVSGKTIAHHKPDFTVTGKDSKVSVHETKGLETSDFRLRKALFEVCYPDIPYIVIK